MRLLRFASLLLCFCILSSCTPRTQPEPAKEVVYSGTANQVFATIVRAITTSQPLEASNGWIISQSDRVGGFISAETYVRRYRLVGGMSTDKESISLVISPNNQNETAVVTQFTPAAFDLAQRIRSLLTEQFGAPMERTGTPND